MASAVSTARGNNLVGLLVLSVIAFCLAVVAIVLPAVQRDTSAAAALGNLRTDVALLTVQTAALNAIAPALEDAATTLPANVSDLSDRLALLNIECNNDTAVTQAMVAALADSLTVASLNATLVQTVNATEQSILELQALIAAAAYNASSASAALLLTGTMRVTLVGGGVSRTTDWAMRKLNVGDFRVYYAQLPAWSDFQLVVATAGPIVNPEVVMDQFDPPLSNPSVACGISRPLFASQSAAWSWFGDAAVTQGYTWSCVDNNTALSFTSVGSVTMGDSVQLTEDMTLIGQFL